MKTPAELLKKFHAMGQKHEKEQNLKEALRCYNWAAEKGCLDSLLALEKMAFGGCLDAQLALAKMYEEGKGTEIDVRKAFDFYKNVADKRGDYTALFKVGCAYFNGETAGVSLKNLALAIEYLEKIPEGQLPFSGELILGIIHYYAQELKNHKKKAFAYLWTAVGKLTTSTNIENQAMAHAYLGAIFMDEESDNKSLFESNSNIYRAFCFNPLTAPITIQLIEIVKKALTGLSIIDHFYMIELFLGKRTADNLPCSGVATYTFSEKAGFQASLYIKELLKKLDNKEILTEEEKIIKNTLIDDEARMTILSPEQALKLATKELNQTKMRRNYLLRYLSIAENGDGISLYYKGLCQLANYIDGDNGIDFIKLSAQRQCKEAMEYMKLYSEKEAPNHLAILLQAAKNAQEKSLYHIAKFHYSKAKQLILPRDKKNLKEYLQQLAVLEATLGDVNTAKIHFNTLLKQYPADMEIRYKAMELYTKKDHVDCAISLLLENKTLLKRLTKEGIEENGWRQTLYGTYALSEAQNLFDKNDMKQGILLVKSAAATGFVPARLQLALCYLEGWGVARNLQEAWQCFHAIKMDPAAAYYLGVLSVYKIDANKTGKKLQDYFNGYSGELISDYLAKGTTAEGLITLGNKAFEKKMYRIAILHYTAASEKEPQNTKALLKRSLCYIKWAEWDIALPMLKEVLQKEPANEEAILAKLQCLTLQNKLDKAVALLQDNPLLHASIASCQDKRSWQKFLCLAFEKSKSMEVPVPVTADNPPTLDFAKPVIKKPLKIKHQKKPKPKSIQFWIDTIYACSTSEAFMDVFESICKQQGNPQVEVAEKLTMWVREHPQYKTEILQKLQEQPGIYEKYINEWIILSEEKPAIARIEIKAAPTNHPAVSTPIYPPQLSTEKNTHIDGPVAITPIEKSANRKITNCLNRTKSLTECLSRIDWYMNNQIINKTALFGGDLYQFAEFIKQIQYLKGYRLVCDTYFWFIDINYSAFINRAHTVPSSFMNNLLTMQTYMLYIHKIISSLELRMNQLPAIINNISESLTEVSTQRESLDQLKNILKNFHLIRKKMNDNLRNIGANFIFAPHPLLIDHMFDRLHTMGQKCVLTGSAARKIYENEQDVSGTKQDILSKDLDFVLGDADQVKLFAWGFVKNPYLINLDIYSKKIWAKDHGMISLDLLCKPDLGNSLKKDAESRALKREVYLDDMGNILDMTGEAFFHIDNNFIGIPGNPLERVEQDPTLLLRVIDDVLRILQKGAKPTIEESTLIAIKTWTKDANFSQKTEHIHALARKYIVQWGCANFAQKLDEYGLLTRMFDITHEDDWEKTAVMFNSQVAKKTVSALGLDSIPSLGALGIFSKSLPANVALHTSPNLQTKPSS